MILKVLVDNNTLIDRYFLGEPGVSYLIEDQGKKILFDTGYSDVFMRNATKMNESLSDLDYIVFSHGHIDHTWGVAYLIRDYGEKKIEGVAYKKPLIVAHSSAFQRKVFGDDDEIGSLITAEKLGHHFRMGLCDGPKWLTDSLVYLGEIKRTNDFENREPIGKCSCGSVWQDDYLLDDTAIVYKSSKGLVVITGCSHAGICNIIEYAKEICGDSRVVDVIGGFHLLEPDAVQLQGTVEYFGGLGVEKIHACHCTDLNSKIALSKVVELGQVGVGLIKKY